MQKVHSTIRPDLIQSIESSKQSTHIRNIIDERSIIELEENINKFVQESRKRNRRNALPAVQQV